MRQNSEVLTVSTERLLDGSWLCATIAHGYRVQQKYMGYTKKEAVKLFIEYVKSLSKRCINE